jgi:hypothetical protein
VPSTGLATASLASTAALISPARRSEPSFSTSAMPRSAWLTITPELPRAPTNAPYESVCHTTAASTSSGSDSTASAADSMVRCRLVPVSPSATGKTLSASISDLAWPSASAARRAQRRTVGGSRIFMWCLRRTSPDRLP